MVTPHEEGLNHPIGVGRQAYAGLLGSVLVAVLVTGILKAVWLASQPHDSRFFPLLLAAVGPGALAIAVLVLRDSGRSQVNRVVRISSIGILVASLPWVLLMISGVPA
jgi:hypothetical protein